MRTRTIWTIIAITLVIAETPIWKATAAELRVEPNQPSTDTRVHVTPAYTAEQAQAAALAVPTPAASPPASLVVVTVCNQIVGLVAADAEGHLHPLNIEGLGEGRLKSIIARVPERIVVQAACPEQPNQQPIF